MQDGFDPAQHGLRPIHVETVAGTVYACLAETPPDFEPYRRAVGPMLAVHDFQNAKVIHTATLLERANWKLVMERTRASATIAPAATPELAITFPIFAKGNFETVSEHEANFDRRMLQLGLPGAPGRGRLVAGRPFSAQ